MDHDETMIAMQRGWETWQPITIESGYDLTSDKGIAMAKMDIEKANPDVIVFAWVCTPWTLMQNMNNKVPGHAARLSQQRSVHLKMLAFAEWCERRQSANGGLFLGENPMGSIAWQQPPCLRMSRRCYEVKLDQCMFELRAPDTQESIKKPTKMLTTSRSAARNLSIRCNNNHSHRTIWRQRQLLEERPSGEAASQRVLRWLHGGAGHGHGARLRGGPHPREPPRECGESEARARRAGRRSR